MHRHKPPDSRTLDSARLEVMVSAHIGPLFGLRHREAGSRDRPSPGAGTFWAQGSTQPHACCSRKPWQEGKAGSLQYQVMPQTVPVY